MIDERAERVFEPLALWTEPEATRTVGFSAQLDYFLGLRVEDPAPAEVLHHIDRVRQALPGLHARDLRLRPADALRQLDSCQPGGNPPLPQFSTKLPTEGVVLSHAGNARSARRAFL